MENGTRVYVSSVGKSGTVKFSVPGNGTFPWYIVEFDDGTEDRFVIEDLERA